MNGRSFYTKHLCRGPWIQASPDAQPIHPDRFSQCFRRIVTSLDLPRIRLHDLRHTHATLLLKEHTPIKVVSERLGHASPAFTMATYQHVLPGMQADAARVFRPTAVFYRLLPGRRARRRSSERDEGQASNRF